MASVFHHNILVWAPAHQDATWCHYSDVSKLSSLMSESKRVFNNWEKQNKWNKHLKFLKAMFCVYSNTWLTSRCNSGIRYCFRKKKREWGTVDMVWPLRALFDLPEDLGSTVNTQGAAYAICNSTLRISNSHRALDMHMVYRHVGRGNTHTYNAHLKIHF